MNGSTTIVSSALRCFAAWLVQACVVCLAAPTVQAQSVRFFESAQLGPTGQTSGGGVVSASEWVGVSFSTIERYRVTAMGAHVGGNGQLWFSIFETNGTLPQVAPDLNNASAYYATSARFPSEDLHVAVDFILRPGNWAFMVHSSPGGSGFVPANNSDNGSQTYLEANGSFAVSGLDSMRFYIEGELIPQACGNGWEDAGEDCDGSNNGTGGESVFCDTDCTFAWCGDGSINATMGEICDDGADNGMPARCDSECQVPGIECGNARVDSGEACDDGNVSNRDACLNNCVSAVCGDGYLRAGVEECDDGNASNRDGCTTDCVLVDPSTTTPATKGTGSGGCALGSWSPVHSGLWMVLGVAILVRRRR